MPTKSEKTLESHDSRNTFLVPVIYLGYNRLC